MGAAGPFATGAAFFEQAPMPAVHSANATTACVVRIANGRAAARKVPSATAQIHKGPISRRVGVLVCALGALCLPRSCGLPKPQYLWDSTRDPEG